MSQPQSTGNTAVIKKAFEGLDLKTLNMIRRFGVKKTYEPNTVLCAEGTQEDTFYLVVDGRLIVTHKMDESDEDFVMGFLTPGQYFGEMALLSDEPRAATVTTITKTDVLEITKEQFDELFTNSPAIARSILQTMIGIIRQTDKRAIEDLEESNAELAQAYKDLEAAQEHRIARARLEGQLELAAQAQRSLLPTDLPPAAGVEFAAQFEPARQVGGDFYDVRLLEDGKVAVLLADVSDKGVHAALFMGVARTLFLTEALHYAEPTEVVLAVHNGLIQASNYDMFVTALYGIYDPETRVFRYVRAGHDEPLLVRQDGSSEFISGRGRFLGLWADPAPVLEEKQVVLKPGDCLIIYSDGVTDMRNPEGLSFGRDQLEQLVASIRMYDAERISRSIYNVVQQHRGHAEAFDDFTLLVMRTV